MEQLKGEVTRLIKICEASGKLSEKLRQVAMAANLEDSEIYSWMFEEELSNLEKTLK